MKQLILALMGLVLAVLPAAAQTPYQIKSGDVLRIEVLEDQTLNRSVLVAPDGRITLPLAGALKVSGQSVDQVSTELAAALAPNFAAKPTVYVGIESLGTPKGTGQAKPKSIVVFVMGEAAKPGKYAIDQGTTILQFLAEIGGFTNYAATRRIQLHRTDATGHETVYTLNYKAVEQGGTDTLGGAVADGDVFIIPARRLFE
jgi:polysaccharide export outer membrane protein